MAGSVGTMYSAARGQLSGSAAAAAAVALPPVAAARWSLQGSWQGRGGGAWARSVRQAWPLQRPPAPAHPPPPPPHTHTHTCKPCAAGPLIGLSLFECEVPPKSRGPHLSSGKRGADSWSLPPATAPVEASCRGTGGAQVERGSRMSRYPSRRLPTPDRLAQAAMPPTTITIRRAGHRQARRSRASAGALRPQGLSSPGLPM